MITHVRHALASWISRLLVGLVLLEAAALLLVPDATLRAAVSQFLQTVAAALAGGAILGATRRLRREKRPEAAGWTLLCAGTFVFVIAQGIFSLLHFSTRPVRYPNFSDPFFLAAYVAFFAGLLRLPRERLPRADRRHALMDFAVLGLVTSVVVWQWGVRDVAFATPTSGALAIVSLAYALLDMACVLLLYYRLVLTPDRGRMFFPNLLLAGAGLCLTITDLAAAEAHVTTGLSSSGLAVDLGWMMSALFAGLAGTLIVHGGADEEPKPSRATETLWSMALTYGCLVGGVAVLISAFGRQTVQDTLIAWSVVTVLVVFGIRQIGTSLQAAHLSDSLERARAELEARVLAQSAEVKAVAASLRESQTLLLTAFEHSPVPMSISDLATGTFHEVNESFCTLIGYSAEELIGKSSLDVGVLDVEARACLLRALQVQGKVANLELTLHRKSGEAIIGRYWGDVIQTARGTRLFSMLEDITDRKRAQDALRASEARFRAVVENSSDGIAFSDAGGIVTYRSPALDRITGFTDAERRGHSMLDLVHPDDLETIRQAWQAVQAHPGSTARAECRVQRKDGTWSWIEVASQNLLDNPDVRSVVTACRDNTERKEAEEALRASEARYRALFEEAGDYILVLEEQPGAPAIIRDLNEEASRVLGYSRDELIGQPISVLNPDRSGLEAADDPPARCGPGTTTFEVRHRRKDGSTFDAEVRATHLSGQGKPLVVAIERDITDRKRAEEERARLEAQLRQAHKMESVGRLAGGVAHDFNNMLGVIIGYADMAMVQLDPAAPLRHDLAQIQTAARRSAELTRQLLAFARKQTVRLRVLDLNETIGGTCQMLRRLIGENISLEWHPAAELWPVRMDPSHVDQILANLCVNARDAIGGYGRITIETGNVVIDDAARALHRVVAPGEYVRLIVSDDGAGMDELTIGNIFEPFFTTKDLGQGTGLGLATVYGTVKQNDGFIEVVSEPGLGSTFTIYLPRHVGQEQLADSGDVAAPALRGHETVLLVEDEPALLALTSRLLESLGYNVLTADAPGAAMRRASEHDGHIDLLLTDVILPEMKGSDLARSLEDIVPGFRPLFMSGYAADVIWQNGLLAENVDFIAKPFTPDALAAKVREVLDRVPS